VGRDNRLCCLWFSIWFGGCVVCGLVCSTSSGFSSVLFSVGVFGLRFPLCVCVCMYVRACVCVCAWLGAFGISTGEKKHFNKCERI